MRSHCPFVTIAASFDNGARVRQYPWGSVSIEAPVPRSKPISANSSHSLTLTSTQRLFEQTECCGNDLFPMQKMLIRSHFEFLKRHTIEKLYENYRTEIVCHVSVAPEAPMRLNKSRETLKDSEPQQQLQTQSQPDQEEPSPNQFINNESEDDNLFQPTILSPITEEEEAIKISFELLTDKKSRKLKKSSSKTLKQLNSDSLVEVHDDLVSPLPGIQ